MHRNILWLVGLYLAIIVVLTISQYFHLNVRGYYFILFINANFLYGKYYIYTNLLCHNFYQLTYN